jgi:hypothetical protein
MYTGECNWKREVRFSRTETDLEEKQSYQIVQRPGYGQSLNYASLILYLLEATIFLLLTTSSEQEMRASKMQGYDIPSKSLITELTLPPPASNKT